MNAFATVVIPPLAQGLTYQVPDELREHVQVGMRVAVPLGKRKTQGYVIECGDQVQPDTHAKAFHIKSIIEFETHIPCFFETQLEFYRWIADYYGDPLSNVIDAAIPKIVPPRLKKYVRWIGDKTIPLRGSLQSAIRDTLIQQPNEIEVALLNRMVKGASASLKKLEQIGAITVREVEALDYHISNEDGAAWAKRDVALNDEQLSATAIINKAIDTRESQPILLHGITGSGKTEVYIECARHTLNQNRGVLIIVPEIALTPQLIERFRARLGNQIAILHSGLNQRTRWDSWRALIERRNMIAIGARSAIFAPVPDLGLIVVDEEHDSSYKQSDSLRYNARDLAMVRAKLERCPVVLGSATPALETYHHAQNGRYRYLPLIQRHKDAGGLSIEIVDFNTLKPWDMPTRHISPQLHRALKETIVAGDQAFVLYNRRGFASYLQCEQCEYVCNCPNCSVTLTYHQGNNSLLCHYCSFSAVPSTFCPECSAKGILRSEDKEPPRLEMRGAGTEKIFDELRELFPAQSVERLDRDSAGDLNTYKDILDRLRRGEIQILVGTQMLAKGHDLPNVTLVGVADCDVGLHMPDFRAAERVFQLLTQSAGRAGRGSRPGRVILQTRVPKHPSLIKTLSQDYPGFADYELRSRRAMLYPPFIRLLRIVSFSIDKERGPQSLMQLKSFLDRTVLTGLPSNEAVRIMGPTAAPIQKVKGEYRTHLLLKCSSARTLNRLMRCARDQTPLIKGIRFIFDVDPVDML